MKLLPAIAAAFAASLSFAHAESIGINFIDSDDVEFGTVMAGAPGYEQENWNHVYTDWSGEADNDILFANGLIDSDGNTVSVLQNISYGANADPVHYDSANTWRSGAGNVTANDTLMNGYLDDGGNDQPYVNLSLAPGLFSSYDVVVYIHGDVANGAVGRYWLEEWTDPLAEGVVITDQVGISSNDYAGTFEQAGGITFSQTANPTNQDVASGNFIVFTNVTVRNLRIRSAGNGDTLEDFGRGPLNAIQIINTTMDSDGDDLPDAWEIANMLDENSAIGDDGKTGNPDGDGLDNFTEYLRGTNPQEPDTDFDGLNDEVENNTGMWVSDSLRGTNPKLQDSDGDGLNDNVEDNGGTYFSESMTGTNPNLFDSDMDTLDDGWEIDNMLDPTSDLDDDGETGDPDMDDSPNSEEYTRGTDPQDDDSDDDNLLDGHESGTGIFVSDENTGTDPLDTDSDNDTLTDDVETGSGEFIDLSKTGTNPNLADSDEDFFRDDWELANGRNPNVSEPLTAANGAIGLNFGAGRADASLTTDLSAGVAPQQNWNNLSGASGSSTSLLDASGATVTGASVDWQTDEEWSAGAGAEPNSTLLVGWIASQSNDSSDTIDITGIPYSRYDLVIYCNHDRGTEDVELSESNGAFSTVLLHENDPDVTQTGQLSQQVADATGDATQTGSFYYIPGLTAASLNMVINAAGEAGTTDRGAINAIQIIAAPGDTDFRITSIERVPSGVDLVDFAITWNSEANAEYEVYVSDDLVTWTAIDDLPSQGTSTLYTEESVSAAILERYYRVEKIQ